MTVVTPESNPRGTDMIKFVLNVTPAVTTFDSRHGICGIGDVDAVELSAVLNDITIPSEPVRSVPSPSWQLLASWQSSVDSGQARELVTASSGVRFQKV